MPVPPDELIYGPGPSDHGYALEYTRLLAVADQLADALRMCLSSHAAGFMLSGEAVEAGRRALKALDRARPSQGGETC